MPEQPGISLKHLRTCFQDQYGLIPTTIEFLPLGLDSNAGVYRVVSEQGTPYLLKVKAGILYEPACLVPRYLNEQGITSVVAPLPTRSGSLWTRLEKWTVLVYPFLDGDTNWTGMTDQQWKELGAIFQQIHRVQLASHGLESLRKETFDPTEYTQWIRTFECQPRHARSASEHVLLSSWGEHQSTISTAVALLEALGNMLQKRVLHHVICHADLHPANLLRNTTGRVFVIDWDEVMQAPKERDFIFVRTSPLDSPTLPGTPAFFQGYGPAEIDWTALAYYRYERVIQDIVVCSQDVFFRDDWGEEARAEAAQLFQQILAPDGMVDAASYALAQLPPDLILPGRKNTRQGKTN